MAKKKRNNKVLFGLLGAVLVLGAIAYFKGGKAETGLKVTAEAASKKMIVESVQASGKIFPVKEVSISPDVSGEIVELYVVEGDSVKLGQILAKIDPDAYESQVERGVASVNTSKAQLANSKSQIASLTAQKEQILANLENVRTMHARNIQLKDQGIISATDFEASEANVNAMEANLRSADASIQSAKESVKASGFQVKSAEASLKEVQTSLRRTTLRAPNAGIISLLNVEKGERVVGSQMMSGTEMMRIANLNSMEVRVEVSENDIPRVTMGDEVEIEVDAYLDRKFKGRVTQIANTAMNATAMQVSLTSDQVTNFEVTINLEPSSYSDLISASKPYPFRPGMSASVDIFTEKKEGIVAVPLQSVTTRFDDEIAGKKKKKKTGDSEDKSFKKEDEKEVVFVVSADTVAIRVVTTGIQDDEFIEIKTGLEIGDEVVSGPYTVIAKKLEVGKKVRVVKENQLYTQD